MDDFLETLDHNNIRIINDKREDESVIGEERTDDNLDGYYEHMGWHTEINEETFILTSFRDPVKQLCSLWANSNEKYIYVHGLKKELFLQNIQDSPSYLNNQSVSLSNSGKLKNFGMGLKTLDLDLLIKKIDRVNRIILIQDRDIDYSKKLDFLLEDLGIDLEAKINPWRNNTTAYKNKNPMSKSLFNLLSDEEKQYIKELQNLDTALYNRIIENNSK